MKFLLVTTGGTIASAPSEHGLTPQASGAQLLQACPQLMGFDHDVEIVDLLSKDSSNMHQSDWLKMADCIRDHASLYDAIVLLHGTDTLAWTGAALSYLLPDMTIPVVLTGSMFAAGAPNSDVPDNIYAAFQFALQLAMYKRSGVSIAFADVLIHGPRATKLDSHRKNAFFSVDYPLLGEMKDRDTHKIAWLTSKTPSISPERPWSQNPPLETNIALFTVFPGLDSRFLDAVIDSGPKAVVIEAYGSGGLPFMNSGILPSIQRGISQGILFVMKSQTPFGGTDPARYEVGQKALDLGVLSARDLTREALLTKLMLLLPLFSGEKLQSQLYSNLCDDVLS
ncbi:MAG: asparaginase [Fretibacterium sp.]|mgnify:CR=1 FL=1|nr:asparaginase [Fretibacterium sp.]